MKRTFAFLALLGTARSSPVHPNFGNCKSLKVEQLNAHPEFCKKVELTADCLAQFEAKSISHACLENLPDKTLEDLQSKTVGEITNGARENMPKATKFWRYLLNKFKDWAKKDEIIDWLVSDEAFMGKLLDDTTVPRNLLAHIFTKVSVPKLKPAQCEKLCPELTKALAHDAFSDIHKDCFRALKPEIFATMDSEFFKGIKSDVFEDITAAQASRLPPNAVKNMSDAQAEHWGVEPKLPTVNPEGSKEEQNKQKAARQKYVDEHPCSQVSKWIENTPDKTKRILHRRCDEVLKAKNSADSFVVSTFSTMVIVFGVVAYATFVL